MRRGKHSLIRVMNLYLSPHDAAVKADRECPRCHGTGRRLDFVVSGMRVLAPCDCPLGGNETTLCEIDNPRAAKHRQPSEHRRPSNIAGRAKSTAAYWFRIRRPADVLAELRY
jgi:hypothetical protein